jgi:hypothetical protein
MKHNLFSLADWLRAENNRGYGPLPIPQPRDAEISNLLKNWMALDGPSRMASAIGIQEEQRFTLLAYSERMASLAVRERNPELLILGLLALAIDGWRGDWRDNVSVVSLHHDAAQRIGVSSENIFETVARLVSKTPADGLRSFLHRSARDKSIEAMGYVVEADNDGVRYRRTW